MNRYNLDFKKVIEYFRDHIYWGNTLSEIVLDKINFSDGHFFTILPTNANFDRIEDFKHGGVLQPVNSNKDDSCEEIPNTRKELVEFIQSYLSKKSSHYCFAEDVIRKPTDEVVKNSNLECFFYDDEIYYLLDNHNSIEEIDYVVWNANATYHLLIILTQGLHTFDRFLNISNFAHIVDHTQCIIGGSYDGESYIIWEKGGSSV